MSSFALLCFCFFVGYIFRWLYFLLVILLDGYVFVGNIFGSYIFSGYIFSTHLINKDNTSLSKFGIQK